MQKSILAPSQSITYLLRLRGDESPPLTGRRGSSFHLKEFQRLLGLMASASAGCHLGLLHMHPLQLWLKSRVPWTAWTSGRLSIVVNRGCIEALMPWRNPDLFSWGVPLGSVASRVVVTSDASTHGWGTVSKGMLASGLWSEPQSRWHINCLKLEAVFLALKGVSDATRTAACTDSHRKYVRGFIYKSPGRHSLQGSVQAGNESPAMGGLSPLHQSSTHPRCPELRGGHAFEEGGSSRRVEAAPRVGSDDLEPLRESGGGSVRHEREYALPAVLVPVSLPAGRRRAGQQPGCMHFLRSRYCHWCYARSGRSERQ